MNCEDEPRKTPLPEKIHQAVFYLQLAWYRRPHPQYPTQSPSAFASFLSFINS